MQIKQYTAGNSGLYWTKLHKTKKITWASSQTLDKRDGGDHEGKRDIRRQRTVNSGDSTREPVLSTTGSVNTAAVAAVTPFIINKNNSGDDDGKEIPSTPIELTDVLCTIVSDDRYFHGKKLRTLEKLIECNEIPSTPIELMDVLCTIVSDRYSHNEKLRTLDKLIKWERTAGGDFLKLFHVCNGIWSVSNFIKKTLKDRNCVGRVRIKSIEKAAHIISISTYPGKNKLNLQIATKIATSAIYIYRWG